MKRTDGPLRVRGAALFAALFVASALLSSGMGLVWANDMRRPRVTLLGSGNALSVLVTSGEARLLLALGDDPVAFGNALAQVRRPTTPRIDILLVAGRGRSLLVPIEARHTVRPRIVSSLAAIPPSPERDALGRPEVPILPSPRSIDLGNGTTVEVEAMEVAGTGGEGGDAAWRLVVRHGTTSVVILSDAAHAGRFPPTGPVSALVIPAGRPPAGREGAAAGALVVPASAIGGKELRQDLGPFVREELWAIRVFPGDVARLDFVPGGLRLPPEATVIEPSPPLGQRSSNRSLTPTGSTP